VSARFLIRFDDICPTMNWAVWEQIEPILTRYGIRPILAVVPDNQDPKLFVNTPRSDFWERVRGWQANGWAIALHGYQHVYETRHAGLVGINAFSEFAGLPYDVQRNKVERALSIFSRERVRADAWVAPAHAFDATTVRVLAECGIRVISDGFYWRPLLRLGALWIPQQMWRFRSMPGGVWTICLHHNHFSPSAIQELEADIDRYRRNIVSLDVLISQYPAKRLGMLDASLSTLWLAALRLKRRLVR
jgi:predicted deacetylase